MHGAMGFTNTLVHINQGEVIKFSKRNSVITHSNGRRRSGKTEHNRARTLVHPGDPLDIRWPGDKLEVKNGIAITFKAYFKDKALDTAQQIKDAILALHPDTVIQGPYKMQVKKIIWANQKCGFVFRDAIDHWALITYKYKLGIEFPADEQQKLNLVQSLYVQDIPAGVGVELLVQDDKN